MGTGSQCFFSLRRELCRSNPQTHKTLITENNLRISSKEAKENSKKKKKRSENFNPQGGYLDRNVHCGEKSRCQCVFKGEVEESERGGRGVRNGKDVRLALGPGYLMKKEKSLTKRGNDPLHRYRFCKRDGEFLPKEGGATRRGVVRQGSQNNWQDGWEEFARLEKGSCVLWEGQRKAV